MKILFIACYSPMINNSASIETLMYLNNLCDIDNNEVHLITVNFPKESIYYDKEVYKLLDKRVNVHAISGGKLFEKIMPKKTNNNEETIKTENNKISLARRIKNKVIFPDMYYYWSFKAYAYAKKLMRKEDFQVIFSMHEPPSSHLCALRLKKKFKKIPWILYWSDPWLKDPSRENIGFIRKVIEGNMERKVVINGDRHIFVTEENKKEFISKYRIKDKNTSIITRGYDKKAYDEIKNYEKPILLKDGKVNIVYTGEIFSKLRNINPFIKALNELKETDPKIYDKMNVLFFGNIDDPIVKEKLNSIDIVKVNNRINYKEALRYMIHSDILLVFGNKNSKQIPAKIYDYVGTDNAIMVILGDDNDPIINITKNINKCIICKNDSKIILNSLSNLIIDIENGKLFNPCEEYEWKNISSKLNNILSLKEH